MFKWLEEKQQYQQQLFNEWQQKTLESFNSFCEKNPFLDLIIEIKFSKDDWLRNGTIEIDYDLKFKLFNENKDSFLIFMNEILSEETFKEYQSILEEIPDKLNKKLSWLDLTKEMSKLKKIKYNNEDWKVWSNNYSAYDTFSSNEDENELDGLRIALGKFGILTNNWISILDASRQYDHNFKLSKTGFKIEDNLTEVKEKQYKERSFGFNGLDEIVSIKNKHKM